MAWENTLLASRILPPSYSPVDLANNRSQESSLSLEHDGRLTLLVILTTAAGLAVVLLLFILLRIGCLRGKICFTRYKGRRHDRSPCLLPSSAGLDDNPTKGSTVTSQHTIQVGTFVQSRSEQKPSSNYTIKLFENDLIIEQQQDVEEDGNPFDCALSCDVSKNVAVMNSDEPSSSGMDHQKVVTGDEKAFLLFKAWLLTMKNKDWDVPSSSDQSLPLETKSLTNSPGSRYYPSLTNDRREEVLANQRQQILDRFGQQVATGFGFTRSQSSSINDETGDTYSYCYGNQVEYLSGQYGCTEPFYMNRRISAPRRQDTAFNKARSCASGDPAIEANKNANIRSSTLVLQPNFVRSAESLLVLTKEHYYSHGGHFNKSTERV